jgi:hypothetical protein
MILSVGHVLRLEDPEPDQLRHHLRNLSLEAPYLILSDDDQDDGDDDPIDDDDRRRGEDPGDGRFIQARPYSAGYRLEWRDGAGLRRQAAVSLERGEDLLCAYLRRDEHGLRVGAEWRVMRWYNDPYYGLIAIGLIVAAILSLILAAEAWDMIR